MLAEPKMDIGNQACRRCHRCDQIALPANKQKKCIFSVEWKETGDDFVQ